MLNWQLLMVSNRQSAPLEDSRSCGDECVQRKVDGIVEIETTADGRHSPSLHQAVDAQSQVPLSHIGSPEADPLS
jgi:hypothetical protein